MRHHLYRMSFLFVFATILLLATATFVLAAEEDWQVVVYEHSNYQGKSLVYTVAPGMCQRLDPDLKKVKMNDKISSVKVGKNVAVALYEHTNYSGKVLALKESTKSIVTIRLNDKVSSLIVGPKPKIFQGVTVAGPGTHDRYEKQSFYPATETCGGTSYPHLVYQDNATALVINADECQMKATLYEHSDFKGKSQAFTSSPTPSNFFHIGKDLILKASSLKIEIIGKCPVRTQ
jgi:hypothetical protein